MKTNTPTTELIQKRYSCRSFTGSAIAASKRDMLEAFLTEESTTPFGSKPRFTVFAATDKDNDALKGLGTYGFIKGATAFITGAVEKNDYNLEDYGYMMEKNILYATDIGISTCWLGGTFKKSIFAEKAGVNNNEYIPAVAAAGNAAPKKRFVDVALRAAAGSARRKSFHELFFMKNFEIPLEKESAGEYAVLFEMVQKAPSASNKQPWRIVWDKEANSFHFYLQRSKKYYERNKKMFGLSDMQRIDMGIAMCHFELAGNEKGIKGLWEVNDPDIANLPEATEYLVTRKIV